MQFGDRDLDPAVGSKVLCYPSYKSLKLVLTQALIFVVQFKWEMEALSIEALLHGPSSHQFFHQLSLGPFLPMSFGIRLHQLHVSMLDYTLVLKTINSPLSSFFWSTSIGFPSKMMPCKATS